LLGLDGRGGRPYAIRIKMLHELPKAYEPGATESRWAEQTGDRRDVPRLVLQIL